MALEFDKPEDMETPKFDKNDIYDTILENLQCGDNTAIVALLALYEKGFVSNVAEIQTPSHLKNGYIYLCLSRATMDDVINNHYGASYYQLRDKLFLCIDRDNGSYILSSLRYINNSEVNQQQKLDKKYPIITLCGSTKFKEDFVRAQRELSLQGNIVISVGLFGHAENWYDSLITNEVKQMLDDMHKAKIDMSDGIYVINPDDYIGASTKSEIEYAKSKGKFVAYMYDHKE